MSQIDNPVHNLKEELEQMFQLVTTQLLKAKEALTKFDKDLAREVVFKLPKADTFNINEL